MSDKDMALPPGKTCGDCANWRRCKALIWDLNPKETTCDFAPSRFREKQEVTP